MLYLKLNDASVNLLGLVVTSVRWNAVRYLCVVLLGLSDIVVIKSGYTTEWKKLK